MGLDLQRHCSSPCDFPSKGDEDVNNVNNSVGLRSAQIMSGGDWGLGRRAPSRQPKEDQNDSIKMRTKAHWLSSIKLLPFVISTAFCFGCVHFKLSQKYEINIFSLYCGATNGGLSDEKLKRQ